MPRWVGAHEPALAGLRRGDRGPRPPRRPRAVRARAAGAPPRAPDALLPRAGPAGRPPEAVARLLRTTRRRELRRLGLVVRLERGARRRAGRRAVPVPLRPRVHARAAVGAEPLRDGAARHF